MSKKKADNGKTGKNSAQKAAILSSIQLGSTFLAATKAAKIGVTTLWRMRKDDPEFDAAIQAALLSRVETAEDVVYSNALKSATDPRYQTSLLAWLNNKGGWVNPSRKEVTRSIPLEEIADRVAAQMQAMKAC